MAQAVPFVERLAEELKGVWSALHNIGLSFDKHITPSVLTKASKYSSLLIWTSKKNFWLELVHSWQWIAAFVRKYNYLWLP